MEFEFLKPLDSEFITYIQQLSPQQLGAKVVFNQENNFPSLEHVKIAIIGVLDNRGAGKSNQDSTSLNFRKSFYSLFPGNWDATIVDFGDILAGEKIEDTYFATKKVVAALLKKNIVSIVIGGTQDLTYSLYRAYDELEQMVNLVSIDNKFDFGSETGLNLVTSYLTKIIVEKPNNLFNFCNIGYQTYYNSQEEIDLIEKLFFDGYRLGDVSHDIAISEPVFRDADIVSLDLTAVKSSDSGNLHCYQPNGFSGKEICTLSRYAGISDKVSVFGLFNHNNTDIECVLMAQIVWYFIEGFNYRSNEYPFGSRENYIKFSVAIDNEMLVFYKSDKTERWWIEIPFILSGNNKLKRNTLLPCSYDEYLRACNHEIPERWWKAQRKNTF